MKPLFKTFSVVLFIFNFLYGQTIKESFECISHQDNHLEHLRQNDIEAYRLHVIEEAKKSRENVFRAGGVKTLPVVFHVIYDNAQMNTDVTDCLLQESVRVMNEDFRRMVGTNGHNTHSDGVDTEIGFCIASLDPNGNPTSGITRTQSSQANYTYPGNQNSVQSVIQWDKTKYINIYVLETMTNSSSSNFNKIRGEASVGNFIFMNQNSVGPRSHVCGTSNIIQDYYDLGRTLTHEMGHYLDLLHTWQNCNPGDFCADTPPVTGIPTGYENCPNNADDKLCSATPRQYQNYMDYSDDICMNMFSNDQNTRMQNFLSSTRANLWSQSNLTAVGCNSSPLSIKEVNDTKLNIYPNPVINTLNISYPSKLQGEYLILSSSGQELLKGDLSNEIDVSSLQNGIYILKVNTGLFSTMLQFVK